jgi:hypothetical protein
MLLLLTQGTSRCLVTRDRPKSIRRIQVSYLCRDLCLGYPGGVTETPFWMMQQKTPERIIYNAVYGMLPKNKLRTRRVGRLLIFPDDKHPYAANITKFHEDPDLETISRRLWQNMTPEEFIKFNEGLQQKKLAEAIPEYFK